MISILIVDDQNILRQGIQALLEPSSKLKVVGTAEDGESAIEQVETLKPDIVLMDIEMPGMNGITATQKISRDFPTSKVIILSGHEDKDAVRQSLQAGAKGYLLKSILAESLEQAILSVHQGYMQIESKLLKEDVSEVLFASTASSEPKELVTVGQPTSKLKANSGREKGSISGALARTSNSSSTCLQENIENIQSTENKLIPKSNENNSQSVFELPKIEGEKPSSKNKIPTKKLDRWINRKSAIATAFLISTIALIYGFNHSGSKSVASVDEPGKTNLLRVKTTVIKPVESYSSSKTYTGEVAASRASEVGFGRGGELIEVFVKEGDRVSKGTPLAKIDTANLEAQRQGLIAQKEQESAALAELKNGARAEKISAAEAKVGDLQQQLELSKLKTSRREYLYKEGAVSREQLDEIAFNRKSLNQRLANAKSSLNELLNGTRAEQVSAQQAVIDRLNAEIKDLDITIQKSILKSPFDAVVSSRNLDEGTFVEPGTPVLRLVEDTQPKIEIGVPIAVAGKMQIGSKQQVTIGAQVMDATLGSILPEVNTKTRTRTLVLKLAQTATIQVAPKQIARLTVTQTNNTNGYWLPITALAKGDRGLWSCYALVESIDTKSYKVERKYAEILETQGKRVLVKGTFQAGDEIVVAGTHRLVPGQLVTKE